MKPLTIALFITLCLIGFLNARDTPWFPHRSAHKAYQQQNFGTVKSIIEDQLVDKPNDPLLNYNLGTAYYREKNYPVAQNCFQRAATHAFSNNKPLHEKSSFNLGNCFYQNTLNMLPENWEKQDLDDKLRQKAIKEVEQAIEKYQTALKANKNNTRAQANKKIAEELLAKLKKQKNQNKNKKQNDKKDQNKQKQDNKQQDQKKDEKKQEQNKDKKQEQKNQPQQKQPEQKKENNQPQPQNLEKRKAQALLDKLQEDEKKKQKELFKKKVANTKPPKNKFQKPW